MGERSAMYLPNYRDGSIVNLMQSILCGLGASGAGGAHGYLADLEPEEVARARHVVLVVIDGLGQAQLESGPAPALRASLRGTMTSVFPSTTASAVTTFLTGLAPVEHAVTGWFTWCASSMRSSRRSRSPPAPDAPISPRSASCRPTSSSAPASSSGARGLPLRPAGAPRRLGLFAGAHARRRASGLQAAR